jgi:hypothetical protein
LKRSSQSRKIYAILLTACAAGYFRIGWLLTGGQTDKVAAGFCLIRRVTGVPCPSCGTTRSILLLMSGDIAGSLLLNPFGIIVAIIMIGTPVWIMADFLSRRRSFLHFYLHAERMVRTPGVAATLILLVLLNWVWNIGKGL